AVSEVEAAYGTLDAARREVEVRRGSGALAEQLRADTQVRITAGTASPSDLAQPVAELERRRGDLFAAQETAARADRSLKQLMLDSATDPLWNADVRPSDSPEGTRLAVDVAPAIAPPLRTPPEIIDARAQIRP